MPFIVCMWMSDKRYYPITHTDIANRLDLISKVHGIKQAENYFNDIPIELKVAEVYSALLNCYAYAKQVVEAEVIMQQMKDLGFTITAMPYNVMLNLYYQTENREKIDSLMREMDEKGILCNKFTYSIWLSSYVADANMTGIDNVLTRMSSDSEVTIDWLTYSVAANGYIKAGLVEKSFAMLKKSEELLLTAKNLSTAFECLLTQYAATGKKEEVLRLWEHFKMKHEVYNKGYLSMITSLLKLDDIGSAEKIFEEWEFKKAKYDIRIPNALIGGYCRRGLLGQAKTLVDRVISENEKPNAKTWNHFTTGYIMHNQIDKAVEALKEEIFVAEPPQKPSKDNLVACLEFLKRKGNVEEAEEIIRLLKYKGFSVHEVSATDVENDKRRVIKNRKLLKDMKGQRDGRK
ncbi:pentatricopeptide repeat-containing protein At2g20710, mitochondrial-like isoform X2 [Humulus lupulus]|uniref:pentatricopeptide repeat-containing protein At2g20710, mitochondrial-like isoform X2 n=1 Tax=Humulus lupulus TaxID=3486 RepID=UPI002B4161EC|nr:pentatricopeptide repeat-containing protein At2g20710, mitochondrial-like isoform X2 [Humulus lupulus]